MAKRHDINGYSALFRLHQIERQAEMCSVVSHERPAPEGPAPEKVPLTVNDI
jgi:hypothetical protein